MLSIYPNKEAYKEGMTFEAYVKAALPKEGKELLAGKMPEMVLDGISIDTAAFDTFREHMIGVGSRVVKENKSFKSAKKWLEGQHKEADAQEQQAARVKAEKKRLRGKFLPELFYTIIALAFCALILQIVIVATGDDAMKVFKHISSVWFRILLVGLTAYYTISLFVRAVRSRFRNAGRVIRFMVVSLVLVFCCVATFALFNNTVSKNTYDISTKEELLAANNFPKGTSFRLTGDVDLDGEKIKYLFKSFHGTFDGNGYTISNFTLKTSKETGIIRKNYGTVLDVSLDQVTVYWERGGSFYYPTFKVSALVAINRGMVGGNCRLTNILYSFRDTNSSGFTANFSSNVDTCRGHFVASNQGGVVDTTDFTTNNIRSAQNKISIWNSYVGY